MTTVLLSSLIFLLGLSILAYPTISNWLHQKNASHAMEEYFHQTQGQSSDETLAEFQKARAYNASLSGNIISLLEAADMEEANHQNPAYWDTLDAINGIMGVVDIPRIKVALPIYHGTDETALQQGVGHLEGTALPTGDVGLHTVLTGHTGLPAAELFTDLDLLEVGDLFHLEILDQTFTYEVKNIYTVLPTETRQLAAQSNKNLATLVTCTPYGINSHRLLVQGELVQSAVPSPDSIPDTPSEVNAEDVPLALQHVPLLIGIAVTIVTLFCGAIAYFIFTTRYEPKRIQE